MTVVRSILQPVVSPLASAITSPSAGSEINTLGAVKSLVVSDGGGVEILVIGDSTGDQSSEWPYMVGAGLAARYPTHTVRWRTFNFATNAYGATTTISTGSGPNTITIQNVSIGSSQAMQVAGDRFPNAVSAIDPALVIVNHGHNHASGDASSTMQDGAFASILENVLLAKPGIAAAYILQNPNRDSSIQDSRIAVVRALAADRGDVTLIDAYSKFIALGKAGSLYNDAMHPSVSGSQLYVDAFFDKWDAATVIGPGIDAWLATNGTNLLVNGDFSNWTGAAPVGWTWNSVGTINKDTSIVVAGHAWSVRLDTTGASNSLTQTITAGALLDSLKGKSLTLAVRQRRNGASASIGRCEIRKFGGTQVAAYTFDHGSTLAGGAVDGWFWNVLRKFVLPSDATSLRVALYGNPSPLATSSAWFDRAVLVEGDFPRNMA